VERFSTIAAKAMHAGGERGGSFRAFLSSVSRFLQGYFLRGGFLDGAEGFTIAWISAGAKWKKYTKLNALWKQEGVTGRIAHLSTASSWRGGEQQLAYLAVELRKLGTDQLVICATGSPDGGVLHPRTACAPHAQIAHGLRSLGRERAGAGSSEAERIALVHAHDSHGQHRAVLANALFGMGRPLVVSRRVDFPISGGLSARFKYSHPSVRRILCVSEAIRVITAKGLKDPSVLRVVHSGIDPGRFAAGPDGRLRRELGIGRGTALVWQRGRACAAQGSVHLHPHGRAHPA
jgi:hypothetical protein